MEKGLVRVLFCFMLLAFASAESMNLELEHSSEFNITEITTTTTIISDIADNEEGSERQNDQLYLFITVPACKCVDSRKATCNCDITNKVNK